MGGPSWELVPVVTIFEKWATASLLIGVNDLLVGGEKVLVRGGIGSILVIMVVGVFGRVWFRLI